MYFEIYQNISSHNESKDSRLNNIMEFVILYSIHEIKFKFAVN